MSRWLPVEARGNIRVSLESTDGDDFHSFCQSVVRDAGEPYGEIFRELDKVVGHPERWRRAATSEFHSRLGTVTTSTPSVSRW